MPFIGRVVSQLAIPFTDLCPPVGVGALISTVGILRLESRHENHLLLTLPFTLSECSSEFMRVRKTPFGFCIKKRN